MIKNFANILTSFRILGSILLLFFPVFSEAFYSIYLLCGFSDMIDGTIARKTNSASKFGAKMDTVADLLEKALRSKRRVCMIGTGSMSDPYMHCEKELCLTRRCLEIIRDNGFGLAIQTKSDLILRDIDLLDKINRNAKCVVQITLTTYDDELCKIVEPNVCSTKHRIEVLEEMKKRGIPTIVWMTPILLFINDTEENITTIMNVFEQE